MGELPVTEGTTMPPDRAQHSFINHCVERREGTPSDTGEGEKFRECTSFWYF